MTDITQKDNCSALTSKRNSYGDERDRQITQKFFEMHKLSLNQFQICFSCFFESIMYFLELVFFPFSLTLGKCYRLQVGYKMIQLQVKCVHKYEYSFNLNLTYSKSAATYGKGKCYNDQLSGISIQKFISLLMFLAGGIFISFVCLIVEQFSYRIDHFVHSV